MLVKTQLRLRFLFIRQNGTFYTTMRLNTAFFIVLTKLGMACLRNVRYGTKRCQLF